MLIYFLKIKFKTFFIKKKYFFTLYYIFKVVIYFLVIQVLFIRLPHFFKTNTN
jgi:hypothetical protein